MYQCIVCEDWLHQACVLGADAPPLGPDDFDQLVCGQCIASNRQGVRKVLERYAGREGTGVMLVGGADGKEVLGRASFEDEDEDDEGTVNGDEAAATTSEKRRAESPQLTDDSAVADDQPALKKLRADEATGSSSTSSDLMPPPAVPVVSASSLAPPPQQSSVVSAGSTECKAPATLGPSEVSPLAKLESEGGRLNVYLEEGWMMRWCRCSKVSSSAITRGSSAEADSIRRGQCLPAFYDFPYFLEEEEAYEPPDDPDARK